MSSNGMISGISSSTRRDKKQPKGIDEENARILGSSRPTSVKAGDAPSFTRSDYGTVSNDQARASSRGEGRLEDENRLDGNDADVWSSVPGRGLDGRGSIRSIRTYSDDGQQGRRRHPLTTASYTYLKLMYLLVPISTSAGSIGLMLLARYAWPPSRDERRLPPGTSPAYPHPVLLAPLVIGLLAGTTMQALRDPALEGVKLMASQISRTFSRKTHRARTRTGFWALLVVTIGIALHTAVQELLRILSLYLIVDPRRNDTVTTTELFQQSYYLAIGWGLAESFWGISRGWFEGVRLWSDLLEPSDQETLEETQRNMSTSTARDYATATSHLESDVIAEDDISSASSLEDEEENLLDKIEALQRMRGRKDLEDALGKPFPNIAVAVHILWRLDTLLLNLGLTLVISAFYFNTEPIYHRLPLRHDVSRARKHDQKTFGDLSPHRLFPLVVVGIYSVHFAISLVWAAAVRRVGLSAVTWGSLVVSLALFFAGMGSWGGLV